LLGDLVQQAGESVVVAGLEAVTQQPWVGTKDT